MPLNLKKRKAIILPPFPAQVEKHDGIDLDEWLAGLYIMLKGSRFVPLRSFAQFLLHVKHYRP